jgi:hypothetical protein
VDGHELVAGDAGAFRTSRPRHHAGVLRVSDSAADLQPDDVNPLPEVLYPMHSTL